MKKNKNIFYKIYFAAVVIFIVLLAAGLVIFYNWLDKYEKAQPASIVETLISDYLDSGRYSNLIKDYGITYSEFELSSNAEAALNEALAGKTYTYSHSSLKAQGADMAYVIKADDEKVLNVFLKKHRLDKGYDVSGIEFPKTMYHSIVITAPAVAELSVNGHSVPDELRINNDFPSLPDGIDLLSLTPTQTITIDGLLSTEAEVAATENGKTSEITVEDGHYTVLQHIDKEVGDKVKDISEKAAVAYAAYMQKDGSLGALSKYCDTKTPFYKNVVSTLFFVKDHNGYKNEDMKITDLTKYSDSLYSCHVSFKHTLLLQNTTYADNFDKIVFVTVKDNTYKVIDMQGYAATPEK